MNKTEKLKELFDSIIALPNALDRITKLREIKKQYKTSDFYKHTHMPIHKAYAAFVQDSIANAALYIKRCATAEHVAEYVTNLLDHISPDVIENLMDRIVNSLDTSELIRSGTEIGEELKQLRR